MVEGGGVDTGVVLAATGVFPVAPGSRISPGSFASGVEAGAGALMVASGCRTGWVSPTVVDPVAAGTDPAGTVVAAAITVAVMSGGEDARESARANGTCSGCIGGVEPATADPGSREMAEPGGSAGIGLAADG